LGGRGKKEGQTASPPRRIWSYQRTKGRRKSAGGEGELGKLPLKRDGVAFNPARLGRPASGKERREIFVSLHKGGRTIGAEIGKGATLA